MTIRVTTSDELHRALADAPDTSIIELAPGAYTGCFRPGKSVFLRPMTPGADVRLLGDGGPVLAVSADDLDVVVLGATISGGHDSTGGGVQVSGFSTVVLDRCALQGNRAGDGPGGAGWVAAGTLLLKGCQVKDNPAVGGVALAAVEVGTLHVVGSKITADAQKGHGAILARAGAELVVQQSLVDGQGGSAIKVAGTSSQRPEVTVVRSELRGAPSMLLRHQFAGKTTVIDSLLSTPAEGVYKTR